MNNIPKKCPSCEGRLVITQMRCECCRTELHGEFVLPGNFSLDAANEEFLKAFIGSRGNIKEVEKILGISYPTARARLDKLIEAMGLSVKSQPSENERSRILEQLEKGEINAEAAVKYLKGETA